MTTRSPVPLAAVCWMTLALAGCALPRLPQWVAPDVDGTPVLAAPTTARRPPPPGLAADGSVTDPALVERGTGRRVSGVDGWQGEVHGTPVPGSRLAALQVGMRLPAVIALIGTPTDQGAYTRGQPWVPSVLGTAVYRHELLYRGEGRLVFAGGATGDYTDARLVWIVHSSAEPGYVRVAP